MSSNANMETLLHLVPTNQVAHNALLHPDNQRFVSSSTDGRLGLEIGFHVSSKPQGHVITRLGRNADLILQESTFRQPMSAIHAAFEINPTTHLVVLSVRSKRVSSVRFTLLQKQVNRRPAEGIVKQETDVDVRTAPDIIEKEPARDDVIHYGQNYHIVIASYWFDLIWRTRSKSPDIVEDLKTLTFQGYQSSLQRLKYVRSRDRPTEYDGSGALSWHVTRLSRLKGSHIQDVKHRRHLIGLGSYGQVYRAVDQVSGNLFAIKIVNLGCHNDIEAARAVFHREVKIMEKLKHNNIIEYLGHRLFHTLRPEIFMTLHEGSLTKLAKWPNLPFDHKQLSLLVMEQMPSALDYLAGENLIHRDVKPDNILYSSLGEGRYLFQLADFGLAHHRSLAKTLCGTDPFKAPELRAEITQVHACQSPKIDVWSLCASIIAVQSGFKEFPPQTSDYGTILSTLRAQALQSPMLELMARLHPDRRASAAQILVLFFDGKGLTTPPSKIPPIEPEVQEYPQVSPSPVTKVSTRSRTTDDPDTVPPRPKVPTRPLIVHPGRHPISSKAPGNPAQPAEPQFQPLRARGDGVVKRRAEPRAPKATRSLGSR